jgi:THO complex subunit 3
MYVTASKDKSVKLWDVNSKYNLWSLTRLGTQHLNLEKTKEENINLAISPDGNYLGVSNVKDELSFYDVRMLKLVKQFKYKVDINGFQWDKGEGKLLFVTDQNGSVSIFNGENFSKDPIHVISDCHHGHCFAIAVDSSNRFFVTGGTDSLIGLWDMSDFMLMRTLSNNDAKVMGVSLNHEGTLIAAICEDDMNKKYMIEVYDFDYYDPQASGRTLYTYTSAYEKQCLAWNPRKNVLAFAGEDKEGAFVHILNPTGS